MSDSTDEEFSEAERVAYQKRKAVALHCLSLWKWITYDHAWRRYTIPTYLVRKYPQQTKWRTWVTKDPDFMQITRPYFLAIYEVEKVWAEENYQEVLENFQNLNEERP